MKDIHENKETLRKFLLGQIADESVSEKIEEKLLFDPKFLAELEIAEDELIRDFVHERLAEREKASFQKLFANAPERREKIRFAEALSQIAEAEFREKEKNKIKKGFPGKIFSLRFVYALAAVLVVGFLAIVILWQSDSEESLAALKSYYRNERSVEARIVDFDYSPLIVLRGKTEAANDELWRRRIEAELRENAEQKATAENLNALGVFYLIERKFDEAVKQMEIGAEKYPSNAEIQSNLGAAYLEKAKTLNDDKKTQMLIKSLERFNKALELDDSRIEAIFDKALVLQELNRTREAIQAWRDYLQKDGDSKWADEARRNLSKLEN